MNRDPARGNLRILDEDCAYCARMVSQKNLSTEETARKLITQLITELTSTTEDTSAASH